MKTKLRVKIRLMVVLFGVMLFFGPNKLFSQSQELKSAIYLTKSQRFDDAEVALKKLIKSQPNNGDAYFYLGDNFIKSYLADTVSTSVKDVVSQALPWYNDGIKADTANPFNLIGLGRMYLMQGNKTKANEYFSKVQNSLPKYKKVGKIKEPQKHALTLARLAGAQIKANSVDTSIALPLLREAMLIDPKNPEIYIVLGDVFMMANLTSDAIRYYGRADDLDSTQLDAKIKKGNIYMRAENLPAAIPYFEQAIKIDPNFAPAYRELGELYALAGQYPKSKGYYKKYLDLSGNNVPAMVRYAYSLFKAKDYDEAVNQIDQILKVDKSRNYLNRLAAYSCHDKKQPDYVKAKFYIEEFFKNTAADKIIRRDYQYYGRILTKKNDGFFTLQKDTAKLSFQARQFMANAESFDKIIDKNTKNKVPLKDLEKFVKSRDTEKAKADSVLAISTKIGQKMAIMDGEINLGLEQIKKAVDMDPKDYEYLGEAAKICNSFKRSEAAADYYNRRLAIKEDATDYFNLGKVYYTGKQLDKAENCFVKITQVAPDNLNGYIWVANTYASKDPELKEGLAKPKYEVVIEKAIVDSVKNYTTLIDAYNYMGSYYLFNKEDFSQSRIWYNKMITLNPTNKVNCIRAYRAIAIAFQKGKDWNLARNANEKILTYDPTDQGAKKSIEDLKKMTK